MLVNGKEVGHLILGGETFDKSYSAGVKAKVVGRGIPWIGSIKKDGTILSGILGGGGYAKSTGDIVTVIAIYKNAAAILAKDTDTINTGSWISLDDIEFIDDENENGGVNSPSYILFIFNIKEVASLC